MNIEYLKFKYMEIYSLLIKWLFKYIVLELFKNLKIKKVRHEKSFGIRI